MMIPLEEITIHVDGSWIKPRGNPRYMVNLIQLDSEMEHLRDTVFHAIYGHSILFDDFESALEYRKHIVERGKSPPPIYTLSGQCILSKGILDPKGNQMPADLPYILGEQDPVRSAGYSILQKEISHLENLQIMLEKKIQLEEEIDVVDKKDLDARILELRKQINEICNFTLSQPVFSQVLSQNPGH
jgi:hypothetical protein